MVDVQNFKVGREEVKREYLLLKGEVCAHRGLDVPLAPEDPLPDEQTDDFLSGFKMKPETR